MEWRPPFPRRHDAPGRKRTRCAFRGKGEARVPVPDVGGEELPEAPLRAVGRGEERRRRRVARGRGAFGGEQVGEHGPGVYADSDGA